MLEANALETVSIYDFPRGAKSLSLTVYLLQIPLKLHASALALILTTIWPSLVVIVSASRK